MRHLTVEPFTDTTITGLSFDLKFIGLKLFKKFAKNFQDVVSIYLSLFLSRSHTYGGK